MSNKKNNAFQTISEGTAVVVSHLFSFQSGLPLLIFFTKLIASGRDWERLVTWLIIYMQKFHRADWLRARQLMPNSAES